MRLFDRVLKMNDDYWSPLASGQIEKLKVQLRIAKRYQAIANLAKSKSREVQQDALDAYAEFLALCKKGW
jgi:hypothetical protein